MIPTYTLFLIVGTTLPAPAGTAPTAAPPARAPAAAGTELLPLPSPAPWGEEGHRIAAGAAVTHLPPGMPRFFVDAAPRLRYLDPEPDRWRSRELRAMDEAFKYDHYLDLEIVPEAALEARDRWEYVEALHDAGMEATETGFLHFRIVELYQRLLDGFRRWRRAERADERRWIEERIVNDAGILGHYVTDAAQPHHTTIHHHGWAEGVENPRGYTRDPEIHRRFESDFVRAHVGRAAVEAAVARRPHRTLADVRGAVMEALAASHEAVGRLYELEKAHGFEPGAPAAPEAVGFVADRLGAGAAFLRDLWWTAWVRSAGEASPGG